jgi:hypothetical protein
MRVGGLTLCRQLTIIFHGRRDLSTINTYVALGEHGAGEALDPSELLRVPCYLDLAEATTRRDAEQLYREQASVLREALRAADTVLAVWWEPLRQLAASPVKVEQASRTGADLPAQLLMPVALRAADRGIIVAAVCSARTPAARDRLRAAGGLARLPADRGSRALPRGLLRPRRGPRAPPRRPPRPPGGVGRALPRAVRLNPRGVA